VDSQRFASVDAIMRDFAAMDYICSRRIATCLFVAHHLGRPILVEGPAGVGKTELAKTVARYLEQPLVRLQCYEGLDESKAIYEWKYGKQLLYIQLLKEKLHEVMGDAQTLEAATARLHAHEDVFFSEHFLEPRPLLKALQEPEGCVLLVDEVDKSDQEFEALLLEILSDFQVSVPEIGTIVAQHRPFVLLTSNNTREMSDALKRRCLHLYIPYPDADLERRIVAVRVPGIERALRDQLVAFIQRIRRVDLKKHPSVSETVDWAKVLVLMHADALEESMVRETLSVFLKFEEDIRRVEQEVTTLLHDARAAMMG
jgi:MoxR-like ATPase